MSALGSEGAGAGLAVALVGRVEGGSIIDGGMVEGSCLKVYGRVVAEGRERNGETVSGTWARRSCGSKDNV